MNIRTSDPILTIEETKVPNSMILHSQVNPPLRLKLRDIDTSIIEKTNKLDTLKNEVDSKQIELNQLNELIKRKQHELVGNITPIVTNESIHGGTTQEILNAIKGKIILKINDYKAKIAEYEKGVKYLNIEQWDPADQYYIYKQKNLVATIKENANNNNNNYIHSDIGTVDADDKLLMNIKELCGIIKLGAPQSDVIQIVGLDLLTTFQTEIDALF